MKLFKTVKGKVLAGTLSAGLLVGGAGAAAYVSSQSFKDFFHNATESLFVKVAGWAGLEVQITGKNKKSDIETQIQKDFDEAYGIVNKHYSKSVLGGKDEVDKEFSKLSKEIEKSIEKETKDVKKKITDTVDNEVKASKASLQQAAQDKAQQLINAANNNVGESGYVPTPMPGQTPR